MRPIVVHDARPFAETHAAVTQPELVTPVVTCDVAFHVEVPVLITCPVVTQAVEEVTVSAEALTVQLVEQVTETCAIAGTNTWGILPVSIGP
jgi:hypothetical protein